MDTARLLNYVNKRYDDEIIQVLSDYIAVPCQSPNFDPEWATNGLLEKAFDILLSWAKKQDVKGIKFRYETSEGKTPFLLVEVPGTVDNGTSVLLYGHMDKQPPMDEPGKWMEGLGPWKPVIRDGKLYGRGGADDGYALSCAVTAIQSLREQNIDHSRCVIVIEACEESGSFDLPYYMELLKEDIGTPDLVVCLDSGTVNYEQLWVTSALRGVLMGRLKASLAYEEVHSGMAGGIVPSSMRVMRMLLDRLEDPATGEVKIASCNVDIPADVKEACKVFDEIGAEAFTGDKPLHDGVKLPGSGADFALANAWKPSVAYTGVDGIPPLAKAGNVMRVQTTFQLCIRLPPTADAEQAAKDVKAVFEKDPPFGAQVEWTTLASMQGWTAPPMAPWVTEACEKASTTFYNKSFMALGLGGSIPFMGMLTKMFPKAQFVITGILGPKSNAHAPNEFLEIDYTKRITACVASILDSQCQNAAKK